jgi:hypothetical protein
MAHSLAAVWWKVQMWLAFQPVKDKVNWHGAQLRNHHIQSPVLNVFSRATSSR